MASRRLSGQATRGDVAGTLRDMSTPLLWIVWLAVVVLTGAVALVPTLYGPRTTDSTEAGLEVMQFVLA